MLELISNFSSAFTSIDVAKCADTCERVIGQYYSSDEKPSSDVGPPVVPVRLNMIAHDIEGEIF